MTGVEGTQLAICFRIREYMHALARNEHSYSINMLFRLTVLPHYFNIIPVLRSFSKLTGAGPTGLRIQHFIDAADVPLSCSILQSLKGVVNILVAGRAPPMIASFLAGGNLTALVKSMQDSSLDIRPIVDMVRNILTA